MYEDTYPEHVSIFEVSLGVTLLSVDKVRELGRISDEEDGGVVEDPVEVTLLRSDFERKATGVTGSVRRPKFTTDSGESGGGTVFLTDFREELGRGDVAEALGQFEVAMCASTFGVNLEWAW